MAYIFLMWHAEEQRRKNAFKIQRRRLRDRSDPLELAEDEFIANFRLTKAGYQQVFEEINNLLPASRRKTAVRNELNLLAALTFYANGSYQRSLGASVLNSMSQPTFSKCLREVTDALNTPGLLQKYIKFPENQPQRELIINGFMEKFNFPGVLGCIDGTHVAIIRPRLNEEAFLNRKSYHSLNVLIICDSNLNVLHVDARFGGAAHDSYVWNQSAIKGVLENLPARERCWLLGDSVYAQRPWMMTPILGAAPRTPQEFYTQQHCCVRNTVERCIGVLKAL